MSAKKDNDINFSKNSQSHLLKGGSFLLLMTLVACQSLPQFENKKMSHLDQQYRLNKELSKNAPSSAINIYRGVLSKTLYSQCRWFPSDSRYAQIAQSKCGSIKGGLMAFGRFLYEEDAQQMGHPLTNNHNHLESVNFPDECWL